MRIIVTRNENSANFPSLWHNCLVPNWDLKPSGNRSQVQQLGDDKPADSVNRALLGAPFVFFVLVCAVSASTEPLNARIFIHLNLA